jgi:hypothetical protein
VALLLCLGPWPLRAQIVTGRLMDVNANRPVAAAFIQLLDSAGVRRAGAITDSIGRFALKAKAAGAYRLRAERLGYESVTSPVLRLGATPLNYTFELNPRALVLPAVDARSEDSRGCQRRPDGRAVYALWDAIRAALSVTSWTGETGALRFSMMSYMRELDPSLREVRSEERTPVYATAALPYRAYDPDFLADNGYVIPDGQTSVLLGPDADVLLSESFLNTHCFRIVSSPDSAIVGLGFEPLRSDRRADVTGVLWVDRRTAALKHLAYEFVNLPDHLRRFDATGEVHFRRLSNGVWIVDRWWIRAPQVGARRGSRNYRLLGYREDGGTVMSAAAIDSAPYGHSGRGVIQGFVLDSMSGAPMVDALVFLSGTPFSATSSETGRFQMRNVPAGRYALGFTHPLLEELRVFMPLDSVTVSDAVPLRRLFAAPSIHTILRAVCPGEEEAQTTGLVYGVLRSETTGEPLAGVEVRASWTDPPTSGNDRDTDRWRSMTTGSDGRYFLCWVPRDRHLELHVDTRLVRHEPVRVELAGAPILRRDFE